MDGAGGSASGRQFTDFSGIGSYKLSTTTKLEKLDLANNVTRFKTTIGGNITTIPGLTAEADNIRVQVKYANVTETQIRVGDLGATGVAYYGIKFSRLPAYISGNSSPMLDLDSDNSGGATGSSYKTNYSIGGAGVAVVDTDLSIADEEDANLQSATVVLTNAKAGDTLTVGDLSGLGITSAIDTSTSGKVTVTLSGTASIDNYEAALQRITFNNSNGSPDTTDRIITVTVKDNYLSSPTASTTVSVSADTTAPTIAISSNKTALKVGETATLTFTLSEASSDFNVNDITVSGGTLTNFSGSGINYTATFTPTDATGAVSVASGTFTDTAGNANTDGAEADNSVSLTYDGTAPTIAISSDKTALKVGETATLTFTLSEASSDFTVNDITVSGGTLTNFSGSGINYTATFTPNTANGLVSVGNNAFTNAVGNANADEADADNSVSLTYDGTAPTIAISSDKTALKVGETATLTFTLSEASSDFTEADITVTGGKLSNFSGSGINYTATFTPNTANGLVSVGNNAFTNAVGNANADEADADNSVSLTYDGTAPTIAISSDKTALKVGETATLTLTLSEASSDFNVNDITVSGGTLSNFSGSGTTYTATFTPNTANGLVSVGNNAFTDTAGNSNIDEAETNNAISFTYDSNGLKIIGTQNVSEGSQAIFTITLNSATEQPASIQLTLADATDTAILGSDYAESVSAYYFAGDNRISVTIANGIVNLPAGVATLYVSVATINDNNYEGSEQLTLTAQLSNNQFAAAVSTMIDDGSGQQYDERGQGALVDQPDDDRLLTIPDVTVNEIAPHAVFRIAADSNLYFSLALRDGAIDFATGEAIATTNADYQNSLEVYNGFDWIAYVPNSLVHVPENASVLLVRVPIANDDVYEGAHAFTLEARIDGTQAPVTARGIIGDFGTGAIFNDSGAENRTALKDDDRSIKINSPIVNEGSTYTVFTLNGRPGNLNLSLQTGTEPGAATIQTNPDRIEFWDGSNWLNYNGSNAVIPDSGTLLVRVEISAEQDDDREGSEIFELQAIRGEEESLGRATVRDDGTGVIYTFDTSGAYSGSTTQNLDDDFDQDGITPTTEEALATLAASQGIGASEIGDLNGDGLQDAEQNALATLAWRTTDDFEQGNDGTLTQSQAIVSIGILAPDAETDAAISQTSQLLNIRVERYDDIDTNTEVVVDEVSQHRTITLVSGSHVTTPWDPIRFEIAGQDSNIDGTIDHLLTDVSAREGTQVRVSINVRAAGLTIEDVNAYIKYVSAEALAAGPLFDLDGVPITTVGWYDFTRRDPNSDSDGARFVVENGKIVAIELILTDNAFGDNNPALERILDPGVPVLAVRPVPPIVEPTQPATAPLSTPPILEAIVLNKPIIGEQPQQFHTQPIFESALFDDMQFLRMNPALHVLDEVQRVRSYDPFALSAWDLGGLTENLSLHVLPTVNVSQAEAIQLSQSLNDVQVCIAEDNQTCALDEASAAEISDAVKSDQSKQSAAENAENAEAAEDELDQMPLNAEQSSPVSMRRFSEHLRLAANERHPAFRTHVVHQKHY
ncbi:Autotransporter adhesin [Allochromatium warmingii]|uniref:Autotransporter adhesin n=1 Tax=Allochromatium warmingii TaxID=61595 RepID=A0A1H3BBT4_ALLWA|nr:Autotransporter adhesin [Allochromatium warmingii]